MRSTRLRALVAVVVVAAGLLVPVPRSAAGPGAPGVRRGGCETSAWTTANPAGVPLAMGRAGWGDCPSRRNAWWWARWSYPEYPLLCVPATSPLPAWEFVWVTDGQQPRTPLVDTRPGLVEDAVRRAASVFAASRGAAITTLSGLAAAGAPRIVTTTAADGRCVPSFRRATVPHTVLQREPYQNWTDPDTGELQQGLWPWLEVHGFPARDDRRYITVTDTPGVWNYLGGATIIPCSGSGYGPADLTPGAQNCNQQGGTWMTISTDNRPRDFDVRGTGSFGERLAHEFAHGMGAVLDGSPHANGQNPLHPTDCADLLCYNNVDEPGQTYDSCGGGSGGWAAFVAGGASTSRAAYRLDCGRDDYYALRLQDGVVTERSWAATRFAGEDNRFYWGGVPGYAGPTFSNADHAIPPGCTYDPAGWCPPGVDPVNARAPAAPETWAVR
ncbi:MAG TPA: hypothetical protein VFT70_04820 [Nocardioides sp.]|nr:hypothetical protein [Nocardioides sp.]